MNLSISNIAWPAEQDSAVAEILAENDVTGIEVALTKIWSQPLDATQSEINAYRRFWNTGGVSIVAAQSLLYGRSDLTLFDDTTTRDRTLSYLESMIRICAHLGCETLVFGSPQNRKIGSRSNSEVWQEAVDFFSSLGEMAIAAGTVVAIEANPSEYGADFVTSAKEALELVRTVDHPGFRLHLDSACMHLAGDDPASSISDAIPCLSHFHISEPQLGPIGGGVVDHSLLGSVLRSVEYDKWISIEMRQAEPFCVSTIRNAIVRAQVDYS